jgi:hypothetical protein
VVEHAGLRAGARVTRSAYGFDRTLCAQCGRGARLLQISAFGFYPPCGLFERFCFVNLVTKEDRFEPVGTAHDDFDRRDHKIRQAAEMAFIPEQQFEEDQHAINGARQRLDGRGVEVWQVSHGASCSFLQAQYALR